MKCQNCQNENPEGSRFCENCGASLESAHHTAPTQPDKGKTHPIASDKPRPLKASGTNKKPLIILWVGLTLLLLFACALTLTGGSYYYMRARGLGFKDLVAGRQNPFASTTVESSEMQTPDVLPYPTNSEEDADELTPFSTAQPDLQDNPSTPVVGKTVNPTIHPTQTGFEPQRAVSDQILAVTSTGIWILNSQTGQIDILSDYPLNNYWDIQAGISPNKKWFAYFTGFEKDSMTPELVVLDLETRQTILHLPVSDPLTQSTMVEEVGDPGFEALRAMQMPESLAWSPDGSTLAFIATHDGEGADVYIFTPSTNSVTRVSDEEGHANDLHWSPDGAHLQFLSTNSFGTGGGSIMEALWVYDHQNGSVQLQENLTSSGEQFVSWTDETHFLIASISSICELHNLRLVDVARSVHQVILDGCMTSIAYDAIGQKGMFSVTDFNYENCICGEKMAAGLWIFGQGIGHPVVDEIGLKKFEQVQVYNIDFIDQSKIYAVYGDEGLLSIYQGDDFYRFDLLHEARALTPYKSPYAENWAWASPIRSELWFTDENDHAVELSNSSSGMPVWSADGQKLYFFEDNRIFFVDSPGFDSRTLLAELAGEVIIALVR